MADEGGSWGSVFTGILRGALGVKLGPGVLKIVVPIGIAGLVSMPLLAWAFSASPWFGIASVVIVAGVVIYVVERSFRYAERNPLPALMGGGELLKLFQHQMAAKDKAIVDNDAPPVLGASPNASDEANV